MSGWSKIVSAAPAPTMSIQKVAAQMTMSVRIPGNRIRGLKAIEKLAMKLKSRLFLLFFFMAYHYYHRRVTPL